MSLDTHSIALIQDSMAKLRAQLSPRDTRFYDTLFRRNPEMRAMFCDDIAGQGMRFMSTLAVITDALTTPSVLKEEVSRLAEGRKALGVEAKHYAPLADALLDTLALEFPRFDGRFFTDEGECFSCQERGPEPDGIQGTIGFSGASWAQCRKSGARV